MVRHYIETERLTAGACTLEGEEARHLASVLRVAVGDAVEGFDGAGTVRALRVAAVGKRRVELVPEGPPTPVPRPACALTLFVCISKGSRMDWTVEKAVELGAARIVPVVSERTVVRLDACEGALKADRWLRVAREAARQCGAGWLPRIDPPLSLDDTLPLLAGTAPVLVAALVPGAPLLRDALDALPPQPPRAGWFVGPEGDFTGDELARLRAAGAVAVSLGRLVLRAETAAVYGLSVLNSRWI